MNAFYGVDGRFLDRRGCGDELELDRRMKSALLFQELNGAAAMSFAVDFDDEEADEPANH
jgi:hypothetical protein